MTGYGKLEKFLSHIEWILSELYWNVQASPSNNKPKFEFTLAILLNAHFVTFQYLQKDSIKSLAKNNCFQGNFNFYFILTETIKLNLIWGR